MKATTAEPLNATEILVTGDHSLLEWREEQTLFVPGHEFTPRFRRGQWDGQYSPGRWCRQINEEQWEMRCSRGLLGRLGMQFPVYDLERIDEWKRTSTKYASFRDYQQTAFTQALHHRWGRVALATNAGKGAVIALLAQFAIDFGQVPLILCDEVAVFDALVEELFKWTGLTPAVVKAGVKEPPLYSPIVLAMVPTLSRRLNDKDKTKSGAWRKWLGLCGMVLLDEADKATAPGWKKILHNCKGSHWRVGFSGTFPDPKEHPYEDLQLDELMGPVIIEAKNIDMIEQGVSARPQVIIHGFDVTSAIFAAPEEWWKLSGPERRRWVFEHAIMENDARHAFIATLIQPDTPTTIVVNRVAHGEALALWLPNATFLSGSANPSKRRTILEAFEDGRIHVLIVTKILDRGTNRLGSTADLIFVSSEGSTKQTLQRIGRGLRRTGGKEFLRLIDIVDRVNVYVNEDHPNGRWLKRAAKLLHVGAHKRLHLYQDEGFDVEIVI